MDKNQLYQDLYSNYKKANPYKSGKFIQDAVVKFYNDAKKEANFFELVTKKIEECKDKQFRYKQKYFTAGSSSASCMRDEKIDGSSSTTNINATMNPQEELQQVNALLDIEVKPMDTLKSPLESSISVKRNATPAQDKLKQEIASLNIEIEAIVTKKESGILDDELEKVLQSKFASVETKKRKLNRIKENLIRKRKDRLEFKKKLASICERIPEAWEMLQMKNLGQRK